MVTFRIISILCQSIEFSIRFCLVNIPSYILAKSPEIDRICGILIGYIHLQMVGFCWAFLVNAGFAVACQTASFFPLNMSYQEASTLQLVVSFYFCYASARVVISFAQNLIHLALQSVQDFPELEKIFKYSRHGSMSRINALFVPGAVLNICVIFSDSICNSDSLLSKYVCEHSGMYYLTSKFPEVRRLLFYTCLILVVQTGQMFLNQFPRWDQTLKSLRHIPRTILQLTVLALSTLTILALASLLSETIYSSCYSPSPSTSTSTSPSLSSLSSSSHLSSSSTTSSTSDVTCNTTFINASNTEGILLWILHIPGAIVSFLRIIQAYWHIIIILLWNTLGLSVEILMWSILLGWNAWLYIFSNILIQNEGHIWSKRVNLKSLLHLASLLRISNVILMIIFFWLSCFSSGFLQAQLDLTLLSIILPGISTLIYISTIINFKISLSEMIHGSIASIIAAFIVCMLMTAKIGGKGSVLLVYFHLFGKFVQYFGDDLRVWGEDEESEDDSPSIPLPSISKSHRGSKLPLSDENDLRSGGSNRESLDATVDIKFSSSTPHAVHALESRGAVDSSLVSIGIPKRLLDNKIVRSCRRVVGLAARITRALTVTDSVLSGVMRAGTTIGVIVGIILAMISVGSVIQQNTNFFPKLIYYHNKKLPSSTLDSTGSRGSNVITFDHIISNVSLYRYDIIGSTSDDRVYPHYASCSLRWHKLSLVDLSLFAELSYFDDSSSSVDETSTYPTMQQMLDDIFPDMGFVHVKTNPSNCESDASSSVGCNNIGYVNGYVNAHPMYLEVKSEKLGVTVIAVRGTDIGILHDFLEDAKLFAEPVIFTLLSYVFPVIRTWPSSTTGAVIEILHEINVFFGLSGEAEYYQPLAQRVREISRSKECIENRQKVILTGHSLGEKALVNYHLCM